MQLLSARLTSVGALAGVGARALRAGGGCAFQQCSRRIGMAAQAAVQQQAEIQRWASEGTNRSCRGRSTVGVFVNSNYDSGNVDVVRITNPLDHVTHEVELKIHPDPYCASDKREHSQWFYFRVSNCADETLNVRILNAGQCSYPSAWKGYSVCASYDKKHWFRVPTSYDAATGVLSWTHVPAKGNVYYAYFAPYSYERHQQLVAEMQCYEDITLEMLGETLDGHDLDLLQVGREGEGKRRIWVVARQHPGESMAEWFVEGMLRRLLDRADPVSRSLLRDTVFYVVPCMCPDGVFRGHLRTNAAGANLNREWAAPSAEESPEVLLVLREMEEVGCDLLVDVHGDEELPYVFVAGNQGIPRWGPRLAGLHDAFCDAFKAASPDFQTKYGYPVAAPNTANLSLCSKQIGQKFDCLAVTLEMPFKDNANLPCPEQGWSPERSMKLGGAMLEAVLAVAPQLR